MIFTNRGELSEYIHHLEKIIDYMADDLLMVSLHLGLHETKESVLDAYSLAAKGPTILEQILIKQGAIDANDVLFNVFSEDLKHRIEGIREDAVADCARLLAKSCWERK